jgi:hypothetical protein
MPRCLRKIESDARNKRIEEVMLSEPTLTNGQLCERFGCTSSIITKIRKKLNQETPDPFDLIKRKDAAKAAKKLGLTKTRKENIAEFKSMMHYRIQSSMRDKEQGNDYDCRDS